MKIFNIILYSALVLFLGWTLYFLLNSYFVYTIIIWMFEETNLTTLILKFWELHIVAILIIGFLGFSLYKLYKAIFN